MKKENGITLIALVITIIVMLILVGVTVTVALQGGLFEKARKAANDTQDARIYEEMLSVVIGYSGGREMTSDDVSNLKTELQKIDGIDSIEGDTFPLKVTSINGGEWKIQSNGNIEEKKPLDPNWWIPTPDENVILRSNDGVCAGVENNYDLVQFNPMMER